MKISSNCWKTEIHRHEILNEHKMQKTQKPEYIINNGKPKRKSKPWKKQEKNGISQARKQWSD